MIRELLEEARDHGEHPGLMVALVVPPEVADDLALDEGEAPEDLHVTLAYCRDADPDPVSLARLIVALDSLAGITPTLAARIGGTGRFLPSPGSDGHGVVYASADIPYLDELRAGVCRALCDAGIERSYDHGYTPHITLKYDEDGVTPEPDVSGVAPFSFEYLLLARGDEHVVFPLGTLVPPASTYPDPAMRLGEAMVTVWERSFSPARRQRAAHTGVAMPDGSFPVENEADLASAVRASLRLAEAGPVRRHLVERAGALGQTWALPDGWVTETEETVAVVEAVRNMTRAPWGIQESGRLAHLVEADDGTTGSKWRVVLIRAGTSGNRVHYSEECLRRAVPLFEGVRAYADHPSRDEARNRPERSVRDVVGWYDGVKWDEGLRAITADFNILKNAGWLREALLDAWQRGKPDLFGFSINAEGVKTGQICEGGALLESINRVRSTDVVTVPGAGGRLLDVLEAKRVDDLKEALAGLRTEVLEAVRTLLLEKWNTKGRHLSAAHKAAISASLKAKKRAKNINAMSDPNRKQGTGKNGAKGVAAMYRSQDGQRLARAKKVTPGEGKTGFVSPGGGKRKKVQKYTSTNHPASGQVVAVRSPLTHGGGSSIGTAGKTITVGGRTTTQVHFKNGKSADVPTSSLERHDARVHGPVTGAANPLGSKKSAPVKKK